MEAEKGAIEEGDGEKHCLLGEIQVSLYLRGDAWG
jgi:hypothetical protein